VKTPPKHAPSRVDSTEALRRLQRLMASMLMRPLREDDTLESRWIDGRPTASVAEEFIKPNDRLSSLDRLELYSQLYWYRVIEALRADCPGLVAVIGDVKFHRLARAYLSKHPSRSFTLRNLGSSLVDFISRNPRLIAPRKALALEVARFEWAQTIAFDGPALAVIDPAVLGSTPPSRLRLGLQPYITLLALRHPVDSFMISVRRREVMRSEASNVVTDSKPRKTVRRPALPRPKPTWVVVHRHKNQLYYKRLTPAAFRILEALRDGKTLARALEAGGPDVTPAKVRSWFTSWMALGWFCARPASR